MRRQRGGFLDREIAAQRQCAVGGTEVDGNGAALHAAEVDDGVIERRRRGDVENPLHADRRVAGAAAAGEGDAVVDDDVTGDIERSLIGHAAQRGRGVLIAKGGAAGARRGGKCAAGAFDRRARQRAAVDLERSRRQAERAGQSQLAGQLERGIRRVEAETIGGITLAAGDRDGATSMVTAVELPGVTSLGEMPSLQPVATLQSPLPAVHVTFVMASHPMPGAHSTPSIAGWQHGFVRDRDARSMGWPSRRVTRSFNQIAAIAARIRHLRRSTASSVKRIGLERQGRSPRPRRPKRG